MHSGKRLKLETTPENLFGRIMDLLCPIGIGQCGIISGPHQTGKMLLMENIARAVAINDPDIVIFLVLMGMEHEEVELLRKALKGSIVFSVKDEAGVTSGHRTELILKQAKNLMDCKRNVLILFGLSDSGPSLCGTLSDHKSGASFSNCKMLKQFIQAAGSYESGGSITVLADIEDRSTHSADCGIWQESFDIHIVMDHKVLQEGIFPAVNVHFSRNRKEKELYTGEDMGRVLVLRKVLEPLSAAEAVKLLGSKMLFTKSNMHFLSNMSSI